MPEPKFSKDNEHTTARLQKIFALLDITPISYLRSMISDALLAKMTLATQIKPAPPEDDVKALYMAHTTVQQVLDQLELLEDEAA